VFRERAGASLGVTFFSTFPNPLAFYRLTQNASGTVRVEAVGASAPTGDADSGVTLAAGAWYRFSILTEPSGASLRVRARLWRDGDAEPAAWPIDALVAAPRALGWCGFWASGNGLKAVDAVDLDVPRGAIVALIGPNGAGKTTCFAAIAGFVRPDSGRVAFDGTDVTLWAPHRIAALGMVRTFQITQPFARLSVRENVMVGAYLRHAGRRQAMALAERVAERVGMGAMLDMPAADLTVAGRKRLELARALATEPKLLLLDEVMAGLNPTEIAEIVGVVRAIRAAGVTILLIEHVMQAVMSLAEQVHVLNQGRIIARGTPAQIAADPVVVEAYLGRGAAARLGGAAHGG